MGRPSNEDPSRRAAPAAGPSKRALRMLVSALAGGGLTAAGLGALVGPALGAESAPIGTPGEGTLGSGQAAGAPEATGAGGPGQGSAEQPPSTSTTPAPTSPTPAPTSTTPAFYRIPLFLLPIYQAAAVQYGVPWQSLAAINEIETNYGTDLAVSSAGARGWMQFMPATWLQYGVDALNTGYADPYNPVDAIFAAARYLRAAGAAHDLRAAVLAYNHSDEYLNSV